MIGERIIPRLFAVILQSNWPSLWWRCIQGRKSETT